MSAVKLTYLGHACFCLEAEGFRTVLDPYHDGMIPGLPPLRVEAEAVFCSHQHDDHNYLPAVTLTERKQKAPYTVTELEVPHDDQGGRLRGMNTVRCFQFPGLRVVHLGAGGPAAGWDRLPSDPGGRLLYHRQPAGEAGHSAAQPPGHHPHALPDGSDRLCADQPSGGLYGAVFRRALLRQQSAAGRTDARRCDRADAGGPVKRNK